MQKWVRSLSGVEGEFAMKGSANLQKLLRQVVTEFIEVLSDQHFDTMVQWFNDTIMLNRRKCPLEGTYKGEEKKKLVTISVICGQKHFAT